MFGVFHNWPPSTISEIVVNNRQSPTNEDQKTIGHGIDIVSCEFNKQTTRIIAFQKWGFNGELNHIIFSLTPAEEHTTKSKKTLDEYLRQRRVCGKGAYSL